MTSTPSVSSSQGAPGGQAQAQGPGGLPQLNPLTPGYDPREHDVYVDILLEHLKAGDPHVRNIALAGGFGTGKSSVLTGLQERLKTEDVLNGRLNLTSLSLSTRDARLAAERAEAESNANANEGESVPGLTNLIQKEIVKQLLYQVRGSRLPASRYTRAEKAQPRQVAGEAAAVAALVSGGVWLLQTPARLANDPRLLAVAAAMLALVVFVARVRFSGHVLVDKLSAGPVTLTPGKAGSYFDEHLNEIIYFFEVSQCRLVIFEDLDRFDDPHIFDTLRELNTVLNNSEQLRDEKKGPIRFLYAVRDGIFETGPRTRGDASATGAQRTALDHPGVSRAKFFDLIVPMVPFMTPRTSRDHLSRVMKGTRVSGDVLDVLAPHLTDMRLVQNVRNEFNVFAARVLSRDGMEDLTPDCLLAMVVFKNLHPQDYENLTNATSRLDRLYAAYRAAVREEVTRLDQQITATQLELDSADLDEAECLSAGERLTQLGADAGTIISSAPHLLSVDGTDLPMGEAQTKEFWRHALAGSTFTFRYPTNHTASFTKARLEAALGRPVNPDLWQESARRTLQDQLVDLTADRDRAFHGQIQDAFHQGWPFDSSTGGDPSTGDDRVGFDEYATRQLGRGCALDLVSHGYIDRNYAFYASAFQGVDLTVSAARFVLQVVQRNAPDAEFAFDNPSHDVPAVLREVGTDFLTDQRGYNIQVFDEMLTRGDDRINLAMESLGRGEDDDVWFITTYLAAGTEKAAFVRRLSSFWPEIFAFVSSMRLTPKQRDEWLNQALAGADPDLAYEPVATMADGPAAHRLPILTTTVAASAVRVVKVLRRLAVTFDDISLFSAPVRSAVISEDIYRVTAANLRAVTEHPDGSIALDQIQSASGAVYRKVLADLPSYTALLKAEEQQLSIDDPANFSSIVDGLAESGCAKAEPAATTYVLQRAHPAAHVGRLREHDVAVWGAVVESGRCEVNVENVTAWLDARAALPTNITLSDDVWAHSLRSARQMPDADAHPQADLYRVATFLGSQQQVPPERRTQLIQSLDAAPIPAGTFRECPEVLPLLLKTGTVPDDHTVYRQTPDDVPSKLALIDASENFASYMDDLDLTVADVEAIARCDRPDVKAAVVAMPEPLALANAESVATLAAFAVDMGIAVEPDALEAMAGRGAGKDQVVGLLARGMNDGYDRQAAARVLLALGEPFSDLARGPLNERLTVSESAQPLFPGLEKLGLIARPRPVKSGYTVTVL